MQGNQDEAVFTLFCRRESFPLDVKEGGIADGYICGFNPI